MAEKKTGLGGCLVQILLGVLAIVAAVFAVLFFLSSGPVDQTEDGGSLADDAAATAPQVEAPVETPIAAPRVDNGPPVPPPADGGIDPSSDDQIADDAAAAGMTSRTPSPSGE